MPKLIPIKEVTKNALDYVKGRMDGTITSWKTGYPKLDENLLDGIEWNSTITIGGRPSVGKSTYSDCIIDQGFEKNLGKDGKPDFILLDFNWELSTQVLLLRRMSARLKKSYKHIISAGGNRLTIREFQDLKNLLEEYYSELPITFCEEPLSAEEFYNTVEEFVKNNPGKKIIVRIDHTLLTKMSSADLNQSQMLLNLLSKANILKKKYPIIFIFLTQINREFEERQEDGSDRAYPRQGDVYGGDAAAMFSESMILLNRPSKYGIRQYGKRGKSGGGIVAAEDEIFAHVVKGRNSAGDVIIRYKENFANMSLKEY